MARAAASLLLVGLGGVSAFVVVGSSHADEPIPTGQPATVYKTVTETRTVDRRVDGLNAGQWRARAVGNKRAENASLRRVRSLTAALRRRFAPSVTEALALARVVYGVDQTRRAYCESHLNPYAVEGHGPVGLLQFQSSTFRSTPFGGFSIWSPYAQALAGGWMIRAGRSGEWSCGL